MDLKRAIVYGIFGVVFLFLIGSAIVYFIARNEAFDAGTATECVVLNSTVSCTNDICSRFEATYSVLYNTSIETKQGSFNVLLAATDMTNAEDEAFDVGEMFGCYYYGDAVQNRLPFDAAFENEFYLTALWFFIVGLILIGIVIVIILVASIVSALRVAS